MNHMDSDLYLALVDDQIDVLKGKVWLQVRDQLTPSNDTVLHVACRSGSIRCVEEILSVDESILLQTNSRSETALHVAARQGHYGAVDALVNKAKSTVPQPNNVQNTSSTVLQNLIRACNLEFDTALHVAVRNNEEKVVELLVKEDPSYSYPPNKYDETPLYLAAVRGYVGVTKVILDNCESPTFGGSDGRTALHGALMNEEGNGCMKLLLEKNKDLIKIADNNGWTAFHYVANNNLPDSAKYLLNVDKSVAYLADKKYKRTAIHVAAYKGHKWVLIQLLNYLPDAWDSVDGNGQNILHIAATQDQKDLISFILSKDMKSDLFIERDNDGNTPLHLIAKFGFYADWDVVKDTNLTPRDMFHQRQIGTQSHEAVVEVTLDRTYIELTWENWIRDNWRVLVPVPVPAVQPSVPVPDVENESVDRESGESVDGESEEGKWHKEMVNTHMIVVALTTTVALTAGFAMPGGFVGNQGPNQGSPVLLRKPTFKAFMVADTLALLCSISSLFLYFLTSMKFKKREAENLILAAIVLNVLSIVAMMVAFIAGTSAVLSHSSGLTISVCIISSLFLLLVFYASFIFFRKSFLEVRASPKGSRSYLEGFTQWIKSVPVRNISS